MNESSSKPVNESPAEKGALENEVSWDTELGQHTQNYIEAYHATAEWIRFADAKAAVILTVGGAMAGLLIPTIHTVVAKQADAEHWLPFWQPTVVVLFIFYVLFFLLSGIFAFLCINPLREKGRHPALDRCDHFHPAAISARYRPAQVEEFVGNCQKGSHQVLLEEVLAALLFDAHISTKKYNKVKMSLKLFATSVFFGFAYFLALQF